MAVETKGSFKLTLEPDKAIQFAAPYDKETSVDLKLTNQDETARAFKVKCTSNALFKIRPAVGKLDGNGSTIVKLFCKTLEKDEIPTNDKHLFSVYHIPLTEDKAPRTAWTDHTGEPEGSCRLEVHFDKPAEAVAAPPDPSPAPADEKKPEEAPAPAPAAPAPAPAEAAPAAEAPAAVPVAESKPAEEKKEEKKDDKPAE